MDKIVFTMKESLCYLSSQFNEMIEISIYRPKGWKEIEVECKYGIFNIDRETPLLRNTKRELDKLVYMIKNSEKYKGVHK